MIIDDKVHNQLPLKLTTILKLTPKYLRELPTILVKIHHHCKTLSGNYKKYSIKWRYLWGIVVTRPPLVVTIGVEIVTICCISDARINSLRTFSKVRF